MLLLAVTRPGAPCVTWVLDESLLVGDNMLDWVSPFECGDRDQLGVWRLSKIGRPMLASMQLAGADREDLDVELVG